MIGNKKIKGIMRSIYHKRCQLSQENKVLIDTVYDYYVLYDYRILISDQVDFFA